MRVIMGLACSGLMEISLGIVFSMCYGNVIVSGIGPVAVRLHLIQRDGFCLDAGDVFSDASSFYRYSL
jgi:hypothetical protein